MKAAVGAALGAVLLRARARRLRVLRSAAAPLPSATMGPPVMAPAPRTPPAHRQKHAGAGADDAADDGEPTVVVRAAFDIGSSATKMAVARVALPRAGDPAATPGRVLEVLFSEQEEVLVRHALGRSADGTLDGAIVDALADQLSAYRRAAEALGASQFGGVATAVFREARNGDAVLRARVRGALGIDARVVSQAYEGRLGFLSAAAALQTAAARETATLARRRRRAPPASAAASAAFAPLSPCRGGSASGGLERLAAAAADVARGGAACGVLSWDSGGGSFQIAAADGTVFGRHEGESTALKRLVELQGRAFGGARPTANPATLGDCEPVESSAETPD